MAKYCKNYECPVNLINSDYCLFCNTVLFEKMTSKHINNLEKTKEKRGKE